MGVLITSEGIGAVYEVLNWMTGESLYTHQLPRVSREAQPVLLKMYPDLALTIAERDQVDAGNWRAWRAKWIERHGATMAVPKFTAADHEAIDALSELAERVHPSRIVVVGDGK